MLFPRLLLLTLFLSGCASFCLAASTTTCPSVENGSWRRESVIWVFDTSEYKWESSTWTCNYKDYTLWRKVDYKIEWFGMPMYSKERGVYAVWKDYQIGLREDGMVVWKKELSSEEIEDAEYREKRSGRR